MPFDFVSNIDFDMLLYIEHNPIIIKHNVWRYWIKWFHCTCEHVFSFYYHDFIFRDYIYFLSIEQLKNNLQNLKNYKYLLLDFLYDDIKKYLKHYKSNL